jgi:hypothetical protein
VLLVDVDAKRVEIESYLVRMGHGEEGKEEEEKEKEEGAEGGVLLVCLRHCSLGGGSRVAKRTGGRIEGG